MRVVHARPPNFDEVAAVFPIVLTQKGIVFTWGDAIYNPDRVDIPQYLRAHEGVHYSRQSNEPARIEAWWRLYLEDAGFRLTEELAAHRAEYRSFCARYRAPETRHQFLVHIANRLASPMYGGMISAHEATQRILR